jgi:hypothetical protein
VLVTNTCLSRQSLGEGGLGLMALACGSPARINPNQSSHAKKQTGWTAKLNQKIFISSWPDSG